MSATSTALLRACSLLLCLVAGSRQVYIKEFVVPTEAEIGDQVELRCQYELEANETEVALYVKWWWTPESSSSDDRKQIYQRIAGHVAESIHHEDASNIVIKDNDTIVLAEVTPVDSGTYECEVSNIEEARTHGKLIVYYMGAGPVVNVTEVDNPDDEEKALFLIECQAGTIAPKPDLTIKINGQEIDTTTVVEDDNQDGLYSIYATTNYSTSNMGESKVRCEIFHPNANITHAPYVVEKTFVPAGCDMQSTTEVPEDATEPEATPESLQNPSDDAARLHSSWLLLMVAVIFIHLRSIL